MNKKHQPESKSCLFTNAKKTKIIGISLLLICTNLVYASRSEYAGAIKHIKNLPPAPEGYKWAVNPDFSDEFNKGELNEKKWHRKSPWWTNGRAPATFKAEAVSVADGCLVIQNYMLEKPEGLNGKAGDIYTIAGGAVASKAETALYGYYETRMKASRTSMSSTFWLKTPPMLFEYVDEKGKLVKQHQRQELDIIETMGTPTKHKNWNRQMNFNTHYSIQGKKTASVSQRTKDMLAKPSCDDFHTYGCWWVDANTIHFYLDGKHVGTVNPSTLYNPQPFSNPMYMHLVTEIYNWEPSVPTKEILADKDRSSTYYDWVRSYRLIPEKEPEEDIKKKK